MSRIVVSFSAKGHEHLFRALTVVELLCEQHDVLLIVPASLSEQTTRLCDGLRHVELFVLPPSVGLSTTSCSTSSQASPGLTDIRLAENRVQRYAPDLLISGSDSLLPRIGKRLGIRCIGITCQDFADDIDLGSIPLPTRLTLLFWRLARRSFEPPVDEQLVSSFYPNLVSSQRQIPHRRPHRRIGVLLRKELQNTCSQQSHLLVKVAKHNMHWLKELGKIDVPAKIYGLGENKRIGQMQFRASTHTFAEDFLSCAGVVTDVGNQLIGEALVCGKHVLAIPDPNDYHQRVSALFISQCELASAKVATKLTAELVSKFYSAQCADSPPVATAPIANEEVRNLIECQLGQHYTRN